MVRTRSQLASTHDSRHVVDTPTSRASLNATTINPDSSSPHNGAPLRQRSTHRSRDLRRDLTKEPNASGSEDGDLQDDGAEMMRWGCILVVGSTVSFAVGLWSIAIGPFTDKTNFVVSS